MDALFPGCLLEYPKMNKQKIVLFWKAGWFVHWYIDLMVLQNQSGRYCSVPKSLALSSFLPSYKLAVCVHRDRHPPPLLLHVHLCLDVRGGAAYLPHADRAAEHQLRSHEVLLRHGLGHTGYHHWWVTLTHVRQDKQQCDRRWQIVGRLVSWLVFSEKAMIPVGRSLNETAGETMKRKWLLLRCSHCVKMRKKEGRKNNIYII